MSVTDMTPADGGPDLGFDYRGLVADLLTAVSQGHQDRAVEAVGRASGGVVMAGGWDDLRKQFAVIYGGGGPYAGYELLGHKRLSARLHKVYAVGHWERVVVLFTVTYAHTPAGWRLVTLALSDKLDELDALAPFVPFPTAG